VVTIVLALISIVGQRRLYLPASESGQHEPLGLIHHFRALDGGLKRLLLSDIFIRTCEGMAGVFLLLFVNKHLPPRPLPTGGPGFDPNGNVNIGIFSRCRARRPLRPQAPRRRHVCVLRGLSPQCSTGSRLRRYGGGVHNWRASRARRACAQGNDCRPGRSGPPRADRRPLLSDSKLVSDTCGSHRRVAVADESSYSIHRRFFSGHHRNTSLSCDSQRQVTVHACELSKRPIAQRRDKVVTPNRRFSSLWTVSWFR